MKILNICYDDYANFSFANAKALNAAGVECLSLKRVPHPFGYEEESKVVTETDMEEAVKIADLVQLMHSYGKGFEMCKKHNKKCVVYHTGTTYRNTPDSWNSYFDSYVSMAFTDQCEFMELGAKNIVYVATAVDMDKFEKYARESFMTRAGRPRSFGHFPSNPGVKGTDDIIRMVEECPEVLIFNYSDKQLKHEENLQRMAEQDVYIELFKPMLHGKKYGCYGVTAFEAAAMGKPVITQNLNQQVYTDAYGNSPFFICNTEAFFKSSLQYLANCIPEEFDRYRMMGYQLIRLKHSLKATGDYILNHLSKL